jgi:hypothetical protein
LFPLEKASCPSLLSLEHTGADGGAIEVKDVSAVDFIRTQLEHARERLGVPDAEAAWIDELGQLTLLQFQESNLLAA